MKLLQCGHAGCVYDDGVNIVKLTNGKITRARNEIEFGNWVKSFSSEHRLNLIPLLSYEQKEGKTYLPVPHNFKIWPSKVRDRWLKDNREATQHYSLTYPKLKYTFYEKYWRVTRKTRYAMAIQFINTLKLMAKNGYYNPDIHPRNIMCDSRNQWYMIDYGEVRKNKMAILPSLLGLLLTFSCIPEYSVYPDDRKPVYDDFEIIKKKFRQLEIYTKIKKMLPVGLPPMFSMDLMVVLLWYIDYDLAAQITGYDIWLEKQPPSIKTKFSKPHNKGITADDIIYCLAHINDINRIQRKLKNTYKLLYN